MLKAWHLYSDKNHSIKYMARILGISEKEIEDSLDRISNYYE